MVSPPWRKFLAVIAVVIYLVPNLAADLWHYHYLSSEFASFPPARLTSANRPATTLARPLVCASCLITHGLYLMTDAPLIKTVRYLTSTVCMPVQHLASEAATLVSESRSPPTCPA